MTCIFLRHDSGPAFSIRASLLLGCTEAEAARRPNILLYAVDTLRADALGCDGSGTKAEEMPPDGRDALKALGHLA